MSCSMVGCSNTRRFKPAGISFHTFPRHDNELLQKWLNVLCMDISTWTYSKNKVICSKHFKEDDIITSGARNILKTAAIPYTVLISDTSEPQLNSSEDINQSISLESSEVDASLKECNPQILKRKPSNCRTCLISEPENELMNITKKCWLEKSIKDVIIRIVPEMSITLSDEDFVCKKCLNIIKLSIEFIKTCLEVEATIAESKEYLEIDNVDVFWPKDETEVDVGQESSITESVEKKENEQENSGNELLSPKSEDFWQDDDAEVDENQESGIIKSVEKEENEEEYSVNELLSPKSEITDLDHDYSVNNSPKSLSNLLFPSLTYNSDEESNETISYMPITDSITQLHSDDEGRAEKFNEVNSKEIFDTTVNSENIENIDLMSMENSELIFVEIQSASNKNVVETEVVTTEDRQEFTHNHKNELQHSNQEKSLKLRKAKYPCICEVCGRVSKNLASLRQHRVSHSEKIYMCDKCPKKFKSIYQVSKHIKKSHEKANKWQCDECGKLFWDGLSLKNHHRLVHLKEKPFVCCICNAGFGRKDYMQKHMAVHTGIVTSQDSSSKKNSSGRRNPKYGVSLKATGYPVSCKICGKLVKSVHLLKPHLETHLKIRRYKCKFCNLSFTLSNNRDRHQKGHAADPENKFRCNICWKRLKTEEELTFHVSMHENRPPRHSCDICGEKFHRKYLLYNHYTEVHTTIEDIEEVQKEIVTKNLLEYAKS